MLFIKSMVPELNNLPLDQQEQLVAESRLEVFRNNTGKTALLFVAALIVPFTLWFVLFGSYLVGTIGYKILSIFILAVFVGTSVTTHSWVRSRMLSGYLRDQLANLKHGKNTQ